MKEPITILYNKFKSDIIKYLKLKYSHVIVDLSNNNFFINIECESSKMRIPIRLSNNSSYGIGHKIYFNEYRTNIRDYNDSHRVAAYILDICDALCLAIYKDKSKWDDLINLDNDIFTF